MGLFDFVKEAGAKIFGGGDEPEAEAQRGLDEVLADKKMSQRLEKLIGDMKMNVRNFDVIFRGGTATLKGITTSRAEREKVVLLVGNTQGVAQVDDQIEVDLAAAREVAAQAEERESTMYTVQSGDSLSKIAKAQYGDAMKYMAIFEANTPMLKDPNKIYPGQVLRIPPLDT